MAIVLEKGVHDLKDRITQIPIGTSTSNMINHIPLIKKKHGHLKAVLLVSMLLHGYYTIIYIFFLNS